MGYVRVKLNLEKLRKHVDNAQYKLAEQILADSKAYMPEVTGSLQQRSYVASDNKSVVFPGPYGKYLYYGNKMVNAKTGKGPALVHARDKYGNTFVVGLRYKKGTKLKVKEPKEKLTFTTAYNPDAQEKWFEVAKTNHLKEWQQLVADEIMKR